MASSKTSVCHMSASPLTGSEEVLYKYQICYRLRKQAEFNVVTVYKTVDLYLIYLYLIYLIYIFNSFRPIRPKLKT